VQQSVYISIVYAWRWCGVCIMSVLIFLDGVIRKPRDQSIIMDGAAIYKSFNENYRVMLLTEDKAKTDIWLKTNNLAKKLDDIIEIDQSPLGDSDMRTVKALRSKGQIDFVVTDDSELARRLLEIGIAVLVFLNPRYAKEEFRPDGRTGIRSWVLINEELDKQQGLYDEDVRLSELPESEAVEDDELSWS